jgi:hypothetical protein
VQSHLTGLRINQETFQKKLEGVQINLQRWTLLRRSGGNVSAGKNMSTSPGPMLKKTKINMLLSIIVLCLLMFSGN